MSQINFVITQLESFKYELERPLYDLALAPFHFIATQPAFRRFQSLSAVMALPNLGWDYHASGNQIHNSLNQASQSFNIFARTLLSAGQVAVADRARLYHRAQGLEEECTNIRQELLQARVSLREAETTAATH